MPLRKELVLLWLGLLPRLNPQRRSSQCLTSALHNMTKLRQPDLTSYVVVSNLWRPVPKRDGMKFTRGDSILQYPNEDTHGDGIGLNPEGLQTGCWEGTSAKATAQATSRGHRGHCVSGHPPWMLSYEETSAPSAAFPVSTQKKAM